MTSRSFAMLLCDGWSTDYSRKALLWSLLLFRTTTQQYARLEARTEQESQRLGQRALKLMDEDFSHCQRESV